METHAHRQVWSTEDVDAPDAFRYWSDAICDACSVRLVARTTGSEAAHFSGRVERSFLDSLSFSIVSSGRQEVVRTKRLIDLDQADFVLVYVQMKGATRLRQEGRQVAMSTGSMVFVDSARPYTLDFGDDFTQLAVQVPRSLLPSRVLADAIAVELSSSGPGRLISNFLVGLEREQRLDPQVAASMVPHTLGLLDSALEWAGKGRIAPKNEAALTRERIHHFIRRHVHDSSLNASTIAAGCHISRRTLFRVLSSDTETLTGLIRRLRVGRAQQILRTAPEKPLHVVAKESGFGSVVQLHRAFRTATGTTPGTYRAMK
ncbi:helix-turn-helix domain-containing protein [Streptomyces sp. NPDC046984]|uniref:AraC-like ligand-binding domain-containing protein n=1 Tax=Streptomyces sp. NPDC046984 TaxID=3155138 RepID=UPI0033F46A10